MAIPLSSSQRVAVNSKPNHKEHNSLAKAFNSRILSGLGDCAWRIFYYAFSTFRGIRNPNMGAYPQEDEWFKFYGNIEPKMSHGKFSWPETPAGYPEGINVANPFAAWVFGNARRVRKPNGELDDTYTQDHGYWAELVRLGGLEILQPRDMPTEIYGDPNLAVVWADSERQRGCAAFIPAQKGFKEVQLLSLGVVAAARKHVRFITESPILGRYAPSYVPDANGKGGIFKKKYAVSDQIGQAMLYYISYFRGTEDVRARHNLTGFNTTEYGFDFETFFSRQFLLAPNYALPMFKYDENNAVKKDSFGNLQINYDSSGYPQLAPESVGLQWHYPLWESENEYYNEIETQTSKDDIGNDFVFWTDNSTSASAIFDTNPAPSVNLNRFCLSAIFIQSSDIAVKFEGEQFDMLAGLVIDMYLNGTLYETIPILLTYKYKVNARTGLVNRASVDASNQYYIYQFNKIHYFRYPVRGQVVFRIRATENIEKGTASVDNHGSFRLGLHIPSSESPKIAGIKEFRILIKFAHVLEMRPRVADAYVMMRIATTEGKGLEPGGMDPVGHFNSNDGKKVFENYIKYGVAYSLNHEIFGSNDAYLSANPVYESLRKFIISNIKMADRHALVDYEVDKDGNSVLYFQRFPLNMSKTGIDTFRGLGPSITPVGNRNMIGSPTEIFIPIVFGKKYIVLDSARVTIRGYVSYRSSESEYANYLHGDKFTGGNYYYISYFSGPTVGVYELDGIVSEDSVSSGDTASIIVDKKTQSAPGTITNEWSMFMSYNLYSPSRTSAWKTEMYGDIMGALNARCLTKSSVLENGAKTSKNVKLHLANVSSRQYDIPLVVTAPSAYNYIEGANSKQDGTVWTRDPKYPEKFGKSCPIYQKPYYISSVTRVNDYEPRNSIIKVVLKGRLANDRGATGTVSGNRKAWAEAVGNSAFEELDNMRFRTDESAVVHFLLERFIGQRCPREIIGDVASDNSRFWENYRPRGCCYPRFYFVKLIPYVSRNSVMYSDHYRQMEYYLRAMCNGFIDPNSQFSLEESKRILSGSDVGTVSVGGYDSGVGDYLFENLMNGFPQGSNGNQVTIPSNMTPG